ncbi:MAG: hypothetical protein U5K73_11860 [Halofilum sp. (in: g-proteobacteria)]|nr:hypothetical protein [Halofilum sp. (in: g-proteobacteria)]
MHRRRSPDEAITLPYDEPGAIDPAGEIDRFTFTGSTGEGIQVLIGPSGGSDLEGDAQRARSR